VTNFLFQGIRCLDVYPPAAWATFLDRLRHQPQFNPAVINFIQNYYLAGTQECPLDGHGRMLIPTRLREYAGLQRELVFTGALEKFRIWDRDSYTPVHASGEKALEENPNLLTDLGL